MRNAHTQRESQRDYARQLMIERAHSAMDNLDFPPSADLVERLARGAAALEQRILKLTEHLKDDVNVHGKALSAKDAEITTCESKILSLQEQIGALSLQLESRDVTESHLLNQITELESVAKDRGIIIQKLQTRIVGNYQDKSGAVAAKEAEIATLREEYEKLRALWRQDCGLLMEMSGEIAILKVALAHATNPITEPVDEPDVTELTSNTPIDSEFGFDDRDVPLPAMPIYFEPPVSEEEK